MVSDMNIFVWNCLRSQRKKKFFSLIFSLLRYPLTVFLPPLPKVGCQIFLEIQNPWGKVIARSGLTFDHFFWKWSKIAAQKKVFFVADFALVHPPMASVLLSASVERCFVSRMRDFCIYSGKTSEIFRLHHTFPFFFLK